MKGIVIILLLLLPSALEAQRFISELSRVNFFSKATIEDIAAANQKSVCLFDVSTSDIAFSIPIGEFVFEKSLMKEHFNEKYMETEKYPKATFQGKLSGYVHGTVGAQQVKATGKLMIHGVTKDVEASGTAELVNSKLTLKSSFQVRLEEYNVPRPKLLWQNIAESVEVTIDFTLKPYEK